jgi:hypothetical protein
MTSAPADARVTRLVAWLTRIAVIVAALATASWGAGAHIAVRYLNPAAGEWWNAHEFVLMQSASAAFGMLLGIRLGARCVACAALRRRIVASALIAGAVLLAAVARICAIAARYGWAGRSGRVADWFIAVAGYSAGSFLSRLTMALVYSLKIVALGLMVGLALAALAAAAMIAADHVPARQS